MNKRILFLMAIFFIGIHGGLIAKCRPGQTRLFYSKEKADCIRYFVFLDEDCKETRKERIPENVYAQGIGDFTIYSIRLNLKERFGGGEQVRAYNKQGEEVFSY